MDNNHFWQFYDQNRGKIFGGICGLLIAMFIIHYGFFNTLLVAAFVIAGAYLGARKENRDRVISIFIRLLRGRKEG
ncbi:MAG: DUF2273 domain-containing protein [Clostridiales bacterium]|nr:DUF2273 domain-containing protein [Clostridiales bacterium]